MGIVGAYHSLTGMVEMGFGSDKLAHVHAGLAIYVGAQALFRDRRASRTALQLVITLAVLNEAMDRLFWGGWRLHDTIGDLAATCFWPAMLFALARWRRALWQGQVPATVRSSRRPRRLPAAQVA